MFAHGLPVTSGRPSPAFGRQRLQFRTTHCRVYPTRCGTIRCLKDDSDKKLEKKQTVMDDLKEKGLSEASAQKLLQTWKSKGAETPEAMRKLFLANLSKPVTKGVQLLALDLVASLGAFVAMGLIAGRPDMPYQGVAHFVAGVAAFYYAIACLFDLATIAGVLFSVLRFDADAEAVVEAVRELAYPAGDPGLNRALDAVNVVRVVQALNSVSGALKERALGGESDPLDSLSAYLLLDEAVGNGEFDDLDGGEVHRIADVFIKFDRNKDGVLESEELKELCAEMGQELNEKEVKLAIAVLDRAGSGVIKFSDFVHWWMNEIKAPEHDLEASTDAA